MTDATPLDDPARRRDPSSPALAKAGPDRPARRGHPAARSRIAATGIGVAAMVGLVSTMQVTAGWSQGATTTPTTTSQHGAAAANRGAAVRARLAAAAIPQPIVLTPRAVVHTLNVQVAGASGYSAPAASAPSYSAPAPAAPVASTGGSR